MIESGLEPEFFCTKIARTEIMPHGLVRIYWAIEQSDYDKVLYSQIVPAVMLPYLSQAILAAKNPDVKPVGFDAVTAH